MAHQHAPGGYPPQAPHGQAPYAPAPHAGPGGYGAPPSAPPPAAGRGRNDELMAGGSRTVFEFTGSEADRDHRGSRGTFMGTTLDLSNAREERETNLRSGPSTWIFLGVALLLGGGGIAYAMLGAKSEASPGEDAPASVAAVDQAAPTPAEGEAKAAETPAEGGSGGEAVEGASAGEADPPADDTKANAPAAPADDAKAVADAPPKDEPAEPAAPVEPAKPTSSGSKSSGSKSSGSKSSGSKKTEPTKTEPKPGKLLKPKKPPRDPLSNLPKPPGE
ncbi:hypothetical protein [Paraliomyxa miuraensis]|uniref:hypothetical protein n=1 Tax=Paraliomyxa miuraensis TaxID=376150 RepID=UPI0022541A23|nr:hypothetical protein [Paraliomyxa miuraensis]MCX4244581.1 hypothetical protein [Paraliomyxa miuraensis]